METHCISLSFSANQVGGEYYHKLTKEEMPSHNHNITSTSGNYNENISRYPFQMITAEYHFMDTNVCLHTGGDKSHNNIQPYIVIYMFKRVS